MTKIRQVYNYVRSWFWNKQMVDQSVISDSIKRDLNPTQLYMGDGKYISYPMEKMRWILSLDDTDKKMYVTEYMDCDNFAATLYGRMQGKYGNIAFGLAWVLWEENDTMYGHAVNVYYNATRDMTYIVEPQTDQIIDKPKNWEVIFVIM